MCLSVKSTSESQLYICLHVYMGRHNLNKSLYNQSVDENKSCKVEV